MSTIQKNNLTSVVELNPQKYEARSLWRDAFNRLLRDRLTLIAIIIIVLLTIVSFAGPPILETLTGINPNRTNVINKYFVPGEGGHLLGTDQVGRDQFSRLMVGGQISLTIAFFTSLLSMSIGVTVGLIAGYFGGWVDDAFTWIITTLTSIPQLFILLLVAIIWTPTPPVLILILGLLSWVETARLVRGEVFALRENEYITAARSLGAPSLRIMLSHLFPNLLPIVLINLAISAGSLILTESSLSFLGLGIQPPTPSWGNMLTDSRTYFARAGHLVIWPGFMISLSVICFYLIGDGVRDAIDPRSVRNRK